MESNIYTQSSIYTDRFQREELLIQKALFAQLATQYNIPLPQILATELNQASASNPVSRISTTTRTNAVKVTSTRKESKHRRNKQKQSTDDGMRYKYTVDFGQAGEVRYIDKISTEDQCRIGFVVNVNAPIVISMFLRRDTTTVFTKVGKAKTLPHNIILEPGDYNLTLTFELGESTDVKANITILSDKRIELAVADPSAHIKKTRVKVSAPDETPCVVELSDEDDEQREKDIVVEEKSLVSRFGGLETPEERSCVDMITKVAAYCHVASERLIDVIPMNVDYQILKKTVEAMRGTVTTLSTRDDEEISSLLAEGSLVTSRRENLTNKIERLAAARDRLTTL
eukprot:TRINITY_DN5802_c0_g1_i1.p1 TRINITY_DN5802_c0_g1~~TRINITY_DN5802_c0_g1_i1.p1  ORF type:complete len:377 (+),score=61.53 TRINITY_DN5802_c0_g1_i1:108-1133(+)